VSGTGGDPAWTAGLVEGPAGPLLVRTAGDREAPPVLLLHGWPQTGRCWDAVVRRLGGAVFAIAPDLRGFGGSAKPPAGYLADDLAEDAAAVLDALGVSRAVVAAHDVGGPAAWCLAAARPERVRAVAFFETPFLGVEVPGAETFMLRFWHLLFHQDVDLATALVSGRERMYLEWFVRHFAFDPDRAAADVARWADAMSLPGALRAGFEHYRAMPANAELGRALAQRPLPMPVAAWGAERVMGDYCVEAARRLAPHAEGGVVSRCGHWIPEETPDLVADVVTRLTETAP
jgi:pimeloyl-ACP methyl ester carboxylesterase